MIHAVIMAGGSGTRFWPASRKSYPKQFLKIGGDQTLIQSTASRVSGLVDPSRTLVVTNCALKKLVHQQIPELPIDNVIGEPCKRDTAPCVALAAAIALHSDPEAIQVVMPSDHVIGTDQQFQQAVQLAAGLVESDPSRIVTFGIQPTYPSDAFGYIHRDSASQISAPSGAPDVAKSFAVKQFKEKPSVDVAKEYVQTGEYYWNAGIFVWKAKTILDAIAQHAPAMMDPIEKIASAVGTDQFVAALEEYFPTIDPISIDYAVMENYPNVAVVEAPFNWDDVGNWTSLSRLIQPDENQNVASGNHLSIDCNGMIVQCDPNHVVVTVGLEDAIVVQTPDATLVANRNQEEKIRQVVKELEVSGNNQFL